MHVTKEQRNPTKLKLTITADQALIDTVKQQILQKLSNNVKVAGFRPGKAPAHLVEKQLDQAVLQTEFLDEAVNQLYVAAAREGQLRPVAPPQVTLTKFVPFTALEFAAEVEVVGAVKLGDYKRIKLTLKKPVVAAKDVDEVLDNLRQRSATKAPVERAAKTGDEVTIDFSGTDAKTKEPIAGADGKNYPLVLGSKSFIPGFEDELIGLKPAGTKSFTITFPKDYGSKALQSRQVVFAVTVHQVQALTMPKLDDALAASIGPFKTVAELKADIKKQLLAERQQEAQRALDDELLTKLVDKSTVAIPATLVDEEIGRLEDEEKRNLAYRGQTWQEHLDQEGVTAEAHREQKRETAEQRIKAGLILGEVTEREQITTTPEELDIQIQLLKGRYSDPAMLAELDKPENRRDINSRLLTEKTLNKLRSYATSK